jgi:hypothetical protein
MLQRFSFLSNLPYDQLLIKNSILSSGPNNVAQSMVNAISYSGQMNYAATVRSAQEISNSVNTVGQQTVGAINSSTNSLSSKLDAIALTNFFGSLMVVGAVAVSTSILSKKLDRISYGIDRLGAQFTEGFSLLATKLDVQNNALVGIKDQLEKIYETLQSPTITQATEWRNLGLKRIGDELYPEAIDAFEKSIQYESTDPISNLMLGKLYLDAVDSNYNHHDPSKAESYLQKAVRYASASMKKIPELKEVQIEGLYLRSVALMAKASKLKLSNFAESEYLPLLNESLVVIDLLLSIAPEHLQGLYQRAKLFLVLNQKDESFRQLVELIDLDYQFLFNIYRDEDFTEFSDLAKQLTHKYSPLYHTDLRDESAKFYSLLTDLETNKCNIPDEMIQWLKKENIEEKQRGINYFNLITLQDCINKSMDYLTVLKFSIIELSKLLYEFRLKRKDFIETFKTNYNNIIREINMEYMDTFLFPLHFIPSLDKIDQYYKSVLNDPTLLDEKNTELYFNDLNKLRLISNKVSNIMQDIIRIIHLPTSEFSKKMFWKKYQGEFWRNVSLIAIAFYGLTYALGYLFGIGAGVIFFIMGLGAMVSLEDFIMTKYKKRYAEEYLVNELQKLNFQPGYYNSLVNKLSKYIK